MSFFRRGIAVAAAAMTIAGYGQASASATVQWVNDKWGPICPSDCADGGAEGGIAWGNRTAEVSGHVWDYRSLASESTVVFIDAYAGTTAIQSTTRTAHNNDVSFRFTIGDPNLVGGINRIQTQVCSMTNGSVTACSPPEVDLRD